MRTGSLRRRTVIATLVVLLAALGTFATVVTVRYRDGLRGQARSQLLAAAQAIRFSQGSQIKPLTASLALEGIDVQFGGGAAPGKPAPADRKRSSSGVLQTGPQLLSYSEVVHFDGVPQPVTLSSSETSASDAVNRLIVTELIGGVVVLMVASALTWVALGSALAPLRHVSTVARQIAGGDRRRRLRPRRPDTELGQMAASFDAMVDSLDDALGQATRSEAAMRRFLADASHELRTPVAALQSTAETLLREQPPRPERDRLEAEVARGSQRLGRLIDDLLNLARLQAKEPLRTEPVDLVELSASLVSELQERTSTQFQLCDAGPACVVGDPDALARALGNVLDNAIRASGAGGEIRVDIRPSPTHVSVSVADNGPGVPRGERERIFEGFVRLNGSSGSGTGLGLAITRAITDQHHGQITCDDVDAGARFTLVLPAAGALGRVDLTR